MQGTDNLWSKSALHPYVEDSVIGWRRLEESFVWLGLDAVALCLAMAMGTAFFGWLLDRRFASRSKRWTTALWLMASGSLLLPIVGFSSGLPPEGARERTPTGGTSITVDTIDGGLDMPAGIYEVIEHEHAAIRATLEAGGEVFIGRFAGNLRGSWRGDPGDLTQPMSASVQVDAASIDTAIAQRDSHARDALRSEAHPTITMTLESLLGAKMQSTRVLRFRALATFELMGRRHSREIVGTLQVPDGATRERLHLPDGDILIVSAELTIDLRETALEDPDDTFSKTLVPIQATLVLRHAD